MFDYDVENKVNMSSDRWTFIYITIGTDHPTEANSAPLVMS